MPASTFSVVSVKNTVCPSSEAVADCVRANVGSAEGGAAAIAAATAASTLAIAAEADASSVTVASQARAEAAASLPL